MKSVYIVSWQIYSGHYAQNFIRICLHCLGIEISNCNVWTVEHKERRRRLVEIFRDENLMLKPDTVHKLSTAAE